MRAGENILLKATRVKAHNTTKDFVHYLTSVARRSPAQSSDVREARAKYPRPRATMRERAGLESARAELGAFLCTFRNLALLTGTLCAAKSLLDNLAVTGRRLREHVAPALVDSAWVRAS